MQVKFFVDSQEVYRLAQHPTEYFTWSSNCFSLCYSCFLIFQGKRYIYFGCTETYEELAITSVCDNAQRLCDDWAREKFSKIISFCKKKVNRLQLLQNMLFLLGRFNMTLTLTQPKYNLVNKNALLPVSCRVPKSA